MDAALILGDQLFSLDALKKLEVKRLYLFEDQELCRHFRYHKKKLVLFLSAMRHFRNEMSRSFEVIYSPIQDEGDLLTRLEKRIKEDGVKKLHHFEIEDKFFEAKFFESTQSWALATRAIPNPGFLLSRENFSNYLAKHKPFMRTFYEEQRKRLKVLLNTNGKPLGDRWSFDSENRKPYKSKEAPPKLPWIDPDPITKEVMKDVEYLFFDHPGTTDGFQYPVGRKEAQAWLHDFIQNRLPLFGRYEDAIHTDHPFLFHSLLTPMMNLGLLTPAEVLQNTLDSFEELSKKKQEDLHVLATYEGFIRQVIGWREFVRGIYRNFSERQDQENFFGHHKKINTLWYEGKTGIEPVDAAIHRATEFGYTHHIERLMVLSNTMLLCEIHPREVHQWFMEMFIDSADWVMGPNVYGMGQFSDGGIFATKPYICGSNYIRKMSNYKEGPWCKELDALYWNFIDKKRIFFLSNPRMSMMVKMFDQKDSNWKTQQRSTAEKVIQRLTR